MSETLPSPESFKFAHPIYVHEVPADPTLPSIFLAGPSPRSSEGVNWRPDALIELEHQGLECNVFVPLNRNLKDLDAGGFTPDMYDKQLEWEQDNLSQATVISFWVPRDLEKLPAFTTNIEFGQYVSSGKVVLGYPEGTPKMGPFKWLAEQFGVPIFHTLEETMQASAALAQVLKGTEKAR